MQLALGIDTGGTYTDAVLVNHETGAVLAGAKALTTRHDLSVGIGGAIRAVFAVAETQGTSFAPEDVTLVALSTTLATNALAEGHGGAVCLLLIGYDPGLIQQWGFQHDLATDDVVYLEGGHDGLGDEVAPLDEAAARAAILARRETVEAYAVSGYFGVRNPTHELRVRGLVEELTGKPVTCGHELTSQLNAVRRATTVALNAHLILPLRELMTDVQDTLVSLNIAAPLMVVRGDGSLVRAEWAMQRPIETILSGPAASAVGAWHLVQRNGVQPAQRDIWTVDVGGTTTDIAALRDGWPILNAKGARVAGWRTMIEAVDVHTTGLGGDSHVRLDREGRLVIGPRRAVPLSLLASEHPAVVGELRMRVATARTHRDEEIADFIVPGRQPGSRLAEAESEILDQLAHGPRSVTQVAGQARIGALARRRIEELERRGLVRRAGFTPTDALHVLGRFDRWDAEAARLGATLLAEQAGMTVEAFCAEIVRRFSVKVATELVSKVLEDEVGRPNWEGEPTAAALLQRALDGRSSGNERAVLRFELRPDVAPSAGRDRCAGGGVSAPGCRRAAHRADHPRACRCRQRGRCGLRRHRPTAASPHQPLGRGKRGAAPPARRRARLPQPGVGRGVRAAGRRRADRSDGPPGGRRPGRSADDPGRSVGAGGHRAEPADLPGHGAAIHRRGTSQSGAAVMVRSMLTS